MAQRVDAAMDAVQSAGANPPLDRTIRDTEIDELSPGDHAVLGGRDGNYGLFLTV
jgi:hypothetical protein